MFRTVLLAAATALIAACQSGPALKTSGPHGATANTVVATTSVQGRAFYLERIVVPSGATLDVQLIANAGSDNPVTITQRSFGDLRGPPFDFTLPCDMTRIDDKTQYSLRATLRDRRGHLQFYTSTRVAVTPGSAQVVELRLQRFAGV